MLKIDLHVHTTQSEHAFATFYEILEEAIRRKIEVIAITDHGSSVPGSATAIYFAMADRVPREHKGLKVMFGCEANIIDKEGNIDIKNRTIKKLDILLVGLHNRCAYEDLGEKENTAAIIKCFEKYRPNMFTHPPTMYFKFDIERVCQAACDNNVLLELNLAAMIRLDNNHHREDLKLYKKMVTVAKKNKKKFIVTSDSHFLHEIGDDSILPKYMKILDISEDMILNNYPEELKQLIEKQNKERVNLLNE